jgi:hypothetical protein
VNTKQFRWLFASLAVVVTGCGTQHFSYRSDSEIPEGPGLLTGEEGVFVLYSDREAKVGSTAASGSSVPLSGKSDASDTTAARSSSVDSELRDFQDFKRWKEANRDSPEYREFREWQEWKAFRAWKRNAE